MTSSRNPEGPPSESASASETTASDTSAVDLAQTRISISGASPPSDHIIRIAGPARARLRQRLRAGALVGRYNVLGAAGEGAMGLVFAAYDSELDRRVALKFFADEDTIDSQGRFRLKREAQALARLSHPNVVQVYDVGEFEGAIYVAMEFVRGPNLQAWLGSNRHWQEVLSVFTQAAKGLAAAHRRLLIHRDFKPSNVLIGHDDRVRVVDFGLARSHDDPGQTPDIEDIPASTSTLRSELTHLGDLIGTPAYMSPEQHMRLPATPQSDQYSFCVSLFEALYGQHPYPTDTVAEAALHACSGREVSRPRGTAVPTWLHDVVQRGMAPDPDHRWPSMDDLLGQLTRTIIPRKRRIRRLVATAALAGVVSAALVVGGKSPTPTAEVCTGGYTQIQSVWSPQRAQSVASALRDTGAAHGVQTASRAEMLLQGYVDGWVSNYREACLAHVRGEQTDHLLHLRIGCLARARAALSVTMELFIQADRATTDRAIYLISSLPDLNNCADTIHLTATGLSALPDTAEAQAAEFHLTRVATLFQAGRYTDAQDALDQITLNYVTLLPPNLDLWRGRLYEKAGRYSEARAAFEASYRGADRTSNDVVRAQVSLELVELFTHRLQDLEASQQWVEFADAVITRVGAQPQLWMQLHRARGGLRHAQGRLPDARREFEHVLKLAKELDDTQGVAIADAHNDLANVLFADGIYAQARRHYVAALELYTNRLGETHPALGKPHNNLCNLLHDMGEHGSAIAHGQAALRIYMHALGPEHPHVGLTLNNLGRAHLAAGELPAARASFERSIKILESAHSKRHAAVAYPLSNLATLEWTHGELEAAKRHHLQALEIRRGATAKDDPVRAYNLTGLGLIAQANGRLQEASELLQRATVLRGRSDVRPRDRATTQYALAKVLWDVSDDDPAVRAEAHLLAQKALAGLRRDTGYSPWTSIPEVTEWLAEHPG